MNVHTHIALNRFGMGARPRDIMDVRADPQAWLRAQIKKPPVFQGRNLAASPEIVKKLEALREGRRTSQDVLDITKEYRNFYVKDARARLAWALRTPHSFHERLVRFWSNHFTVAGTSLPVLGAAGAFEREAIRPNITGTFKSMLLDVMQHPGMLLYLDNVQSFGPNSRIGKRRKRGLNENLAREAMELHTLGVDGGYTQEDVEELAKALTGWTLNSGRFFDPGTPGTFKFYDAIHEPGSRKVLGKTYRQNGKSQAEAIFADMADHPSTARHISFKLARHFVADTPPPGLTRALETAFLETRGDLKAVYDILITHEDSWQLEPQKLKTPEELLVSSFRAFDLTAENLSAIRKSYEALGQVPLRAPSPKGWSDDARDWAGADAIKKRLEWCAEVAAKNASTDPSDFLGVALGPLAGAELTKTVSRAASPIQALTLILMSPEFQRR